MTTMKSDTAWNGAAQIGGRGTARMLLLAALGWLLFLLGLVVGLAMGTARNSYAPELIVGLLTADGRAKFLAVIQPDRAFWMAVTTAAIVAGTAAWFWFRRMARSV